jgi:hypothetical protein
VCLLRMVGIKDHFELTGGKNCYYPRIDHMRVLKVMSLCSTSASPDQEIQETRHDRGEEWQITSSV